MSDMEETGFEDLCRGLLSEAGRTGLVVDLRGNVGGAVSDLALQRLAAPRLGCGLPPRGAAEPWPAHAAPTQLVVLVDETTASDAELVAHALAALPDALAAGAAPAAPRAQVVGVRTWGGAFAMDVTELADGTTISHPADRLHTAAGGWAIENKGVQPHLEVEAPPHLPVGGRAGAAGWDVQLNAAARVAVEMVARASELSAAWAVSEARRDAPIERPAPHWSMEESRG